MQQNKLDTANNHAHSFTHIVKIVCYKKAVL